MKKCSLATALLMLVSSAAAETPPAGTLPPPPSVALNTAPFDAAADVAVLVNVIPADAKFVVHARLSSNGTHLAADEAAATGANLSQMLEQLRQDARQHGANLIVLLGSEHGVDVPIQQTAQPLKLRPEDPSVTVLLFRREKSAPPTPAESGMHFAVHAHPGKGENINYKIALQSAPPGADLAFWLYMNIARFVTDATAHGFNTIALQSTTDPKFQDVWLPGCDDPVRVSLTKPELDVTLYQGSPTK
jgi:hypothetical protein